MLCATAWNRDQFSIPQVTPAYEKLMRQLPTVFVGAPSRLVPLVQLLCEEMHAAFDAHSMTCPPWRQAKAMLSKWLPAKVPFTYASSSLSCAVSVSKSTSEQIVMQPRMRF